MIKILKDSSKLIQGEGPLEGSLVYEDDTGEARSLPIKFEVKGLDIKFTAIEPAGEVQYTITGGIIPE